MSRYARLKGDIDKLKYEKWSKYRFKQTKCRAWGTPKNPGKDQELIYRGQSLTFMFKSIEIKIY